MAKLDLDPTHPTAGLAVLSGHVVIAGFGVPGRAVADWAHGRGMSFCVIEMNEHTVERCRKTGLCMVEGDAADPAVLRQAGLDRASLFACTVPNDAAMFSAVTEARRLNPTLRILARCRFVSSGLEAAGHGADDVIVEEQVVAQAFAALLAAPAVGAAPSDSPSSNVPSSNSPPK